MVLTITEVIGFALPLYNTVHFYVVGDKKAKKQAIEFEKNSSRNFYSCSMMKHVVMMMKSQELGVIGL